MSAGAPRFPQRREPRGAAAGLPRATIKYICEAGRALTCEVFVGDEAVAYLPATEISLSSSSNNIGCVELGLPAGDVSVETLGDQLGGGMRA